MPRIVSHASWPCINNYTLQKKKSDKIIRATAMASVARFGGGLFREVSTWPSLSYLSLGLLAWLFSFMTDNTPLAYPVTSSWESKIRDHLFSLDDVIDDHEPRFRHDKWRDVFENQVASTPLTAALAGETNSLFSLPLGEDKVKWTVWLDKEALWKRLRTLSHVAVLEEERLSVSDDSFFLYQTAAFIPGIRSSSVEKVSDTVRRRAREDLRG